MGLRQKMIGGPEYQDAVDNAISEIVTHFQNGWPVILVAGQTIDDSDSNRAILASLCRRLGIPDGPVGWNDLIRHGLTRDDLGWLAERYDRHVPADVTKRIFDLPWSAIFTSSVDHTFSRRFATKGRQPEPILARGQFARVSRSRSRPPVYHLFGRLLEDSNDESAPLTRLELTKRTQIHTVELVNRLLETATSRGIIVIAGLEPHTDWLSPDVLFAALLGQPSAKVLLCDSGSFSNVDIVSELEKTGQLIRTEKKIQELILDIERGEIINFDLLHSPDEPGLISTSNGSLDITPQLRLRVEASANIVDDGWGATDDLPTDHVADEFRAFHGSHSGLRSLVQGVMRGYAIERDFENDLFRAVERAVLRPRNADSLVLLQGQSASGKTVSLARLVAKVRSSLKIPVLAAMDRIPAALDVDAFCAEVDKAVGTPIVVVCDANLPAHRYKDLVSGLQSRGRRAIVVGSSYKGSSVGYSSVVEAPATLTASELVAFRTLLAKFAPSTPMEDNPPEGWNALAWLYRHLSFSRGRIATGISGEARFAESQVRSRSSSVPRPMPKSQLAEQLIEAGIVAPTYSLLSPSSEGDEDISARLIDLVMVAGRINAPVPVNLLLRALSEEGKSIDLMGIAHVFEDLDIFRWRLADGEGAELLISPRLQLEAELVCQRRLGDKEREIDCLVSLIKASRTDNVDDAIERKFVLDLLQKLDKEGPRGNAYRSGYLRFAEALQYIRQKRGVRDPSLMLRECVFYRQAIFSLDGAENIVSLTEEDRLATLDKARQVIEEAVSLVDSGQIRTGRRTRLNLIVERASIYGYLAVQRARTGSQDSWLDYTAARTASTLASALTDDYHPFDVAFWTATDVLRAGYCTTSQQAELVSDLYSTLDSADSLQLSSDQRVRYLERRTRVAQTIGNFDLEAESLAQLSLVSPASAAFLHARHQAESVLQNPDPQDFGLRAEAGRIASEMEESGFTFSDLRCLRLSLNLRWVEYTGEHVLRRERGRTPSEKSHVHKLLGIVAAIVENSGQTARNQDRYLLATLTWLSGDQMRASEMWQSLSRDTEFEDRTRVIRRLILTDREGKATRYDGRIASKHDGRWQVKVHGIKSPIGLIESEFRSEQIAQGRQLSGFGIAFNYIGLIADALSR